jgi:hypothetical protein
MQTYPLMSAYQTATADGGGKTEIGSARYPASACDAMRIFTRVGANRAAIDGRVVDVGRRDIISQPAWQLPDRQSWQLVAYIRHLPHVAPLAARPADTAASTNVVRGPRTHPDAIIPDLSKPDPLVSFSKGDIAFVYGSRWKQRYFTNGTK